MIVRLEVLVCAYYDKKAGGLVPEGEGRPGVLARCRRSAVQLQVPGERRSAPGDDGGPPREGLTLDFE